MRSQFALKALAVLMLSSVAFTGCKDDDEDKVVAFKEGAATETVMSCEGDVISIPLTATGGWTATVAEGNEWLGVVTKSGSGDGSVTVVVEPNNEDADRRAEIVISNGEQTLKYVVSQTNRPGESANENAGVDYGRFVSGDVPLGWGCRVSAKKGSSSFLTSQIFVLQDKSWNNYKAPSGSTFDPTICINKKVVNTDDIELQTAKDFEEMNNTLKANLKLSIKYGLFKLGLEGGFKLASGSTNNTFAYNAAAEVPAAETTLNYGNYMEGFCSVKDDENNSNRRLFMSTYFLKYRDALFEAVEQNNMEGAKKIAKNIDKKFGPVFISKVYEGGDFSLSLNCTKSETSDTMDIKGRLTTSFGALFQLEGEASASYLNYVKSQASGTTIKIKISGGTVDSHSGLISAVENLLKPEDTSVSSSELLKPLNNWRKTIGTKEGTSLVTDYELNPIWELFVNDDHDDTEEKVQEVLKEYMAETYDYGSKTCPYTIDIKALAED